MLFRFAFALACFLLGFLFFPMFLLSALTVWSIYSDIRDAPHRLAVAAEMAERARFAVSAQDLRDMCESPAEEAFLDAMIESYKLETGEGALEGSGLRLTNQKGLGRLRISRNNSWHQYRADFIVDENLIVEIDGASYHSSPTAQERDRRRDLDLARDGYRTLRIPAREVFQNPQRAIALVEEARHERDATLHSDNEIATPITLVGQAVGAAHSLVKGIGNTIDAIDEAISRARKMHAASLVDSATRLILKDIELIVVRAAHAVEVKASLKNYSGLDRREANEQFIRTMVEALNAAPSSIESMNIMISKAIAAMAHLDCRDDGQHAIEVAVGAHMDTLKKAHDSIFPDVPAFPDHRLMRMTHRETLVEEMKGIFFNDANPGDFHHPYIPPTNGGKAFVTWWREQIAGHDPITRAILRQNSSLLSEGEHSKVEPSLKSRPRTSVMYPLPTEDDLPF